MSDVKCLYDVPTEQQMGVASTGKIQFLAQLMNSRICIIFPEEMMNLSFHLDQPITICKFGLICPSIVKLMTE